MVGWQRLGDGKCDTNHGSTSYHVMEKGTINGRRTFVLNMVSVREIRLRADSKIGNIIVQRAYQHFLCEHTEEGIISSVRLWNWS